MNIPLSEVVIPEWSILRWLLPEGYHCTLNGNGYLISTDVYQVAKAVVVEGIVSFEYMTNQHGLEFKKKLAEKHPKFVK